jgi:hypothetical protein
MPRATEEGVSPAFQAPPNGVHTRPIQEEGLQWHCYRN